MSRVKLTKDPEFCILKDTQRIFLREEIYAENKKTSK